MVMAVLGARSRTAHRDAMTQQDETTTDGTSIRRVTTFTAVCLLVSNMVGTGIFGTTGFMAADLGSPGWVLFLWLLGAIYALLGALCYSELGAAMPRSGGEYVYLREAFGAFWGFLSGWTSLAIGFSAAVATNTHLFAGHLRELLPVLATPILEDLRILELAMVWALTLVHVMGVDAGGFLQRWLTILKVGGIVALVVLGALFGKGEWNHLVSSPASVSFGFNTALVSFMFVTFSYSGWNAATYIAGEIRAPEQSLPRAMLWGTLSVAALYLALNVLYFYALPIAQLASEPRHLVGYKAAVALFGGVVGGIFTLGLSVSILGASSAMIWAGPRVYYAMAKDGLFPRRFADLSTGGGVPAKAILLQSVWISTLVITGTFERLVLYSTFVLIFFAALAVGAVVVLRIRRPALRRPYRTWGYPAVPVIYIMLSAAILWAAFDLRKIESLMGAATVAVGIPFYLWWTRRGRVDRRTAS